MGKRSRTGSPATPATRVLAERDVPITVHTYEHDPAITDFGAEAADKLDVSAERIYKTLIVEADGSLAVVVIPVHARMNRSGVAAALGVKRVHLADPAVAERKTGYVIGGISPVGQKTSLRTVIDDSCRAHATIFVSAGRRGVDIEIAPADLLAVTNGDTASLV
ncbi:Cys-tRNA(Pro) deacylase [Microbacterium sp. MPKO10]|uniref:Cys-tRNA(Pro) deacylase n=1 Tax=Microbacterium sp. MPKO10 TaxID=2989818 RepID=UPI0022363167|nr:Cys-tRNA(Pro) deacylase [Microbacterium sp. MPKO10]MCW4459357.1 Cys-tRNA(Pro) deacylase [Microbacterium sp. MPKO10]